MDLSEWENGSNCEHRVQLEVLLLTSKSVRQHLEEYIRARYPLVYILSFEEQRVERELISLANDLDKKTHVWTITRGLLDAETGRQQDNTADPLLALDMILKTPENGSFLFVLNDFHAFLDNAIVIRKLRDTIHHLARTRSSLFILSSRLVVPPELEKETTVVDFPLPTEEDFHKVLDEAVDSWSAKATFKLDTVVREQIVKSLLGLTMIEAENALYRALIQDSRLDANSIESIIGEKGQIIRKSRVLEFCPLEERLDSIGGLNALKAWLTRKRSCFEEEAGAFGLDEPRGVLLLGVPGCGKSLTAKAIAHTWRMPLLRLDLGQLFGMYVGQSEENVRRAIGTAESIAPCILWIDEIEKGFAGTGADLDSGVTTRVFGTFVTWLQEKRNPVFVCATANDISRLPSELMRKGRFDEIFFVDLPNEQEREDILAVHLRKRKRDPGLFDLKRLSAATVGYTGSDLEGVVKAALEEAYLDGKRDLSNEDILRQVEQTLPLSVTMKEQIQTLREWARTRARPASTPWEQVAIATEDEFRQRRKLELS